MSPAEVVKRLVEYSGILYSRIRYRDPSRWPYRRFAPEGISLKLHDLPGCPLTNDWKRYQIYNFNFDLTKRVDWYFSGQDNIRWPDWHYSKINYRPGNPYGDVRINWELNRLQFLPVMAVTDEYLAKNILEDWMAKNPFAHGPAYLSSMEVALRWLSVYWTACLFKQPIEKHLEADLTGLAVASGKFIESRLSTHSSAGNQSGWVVLDRKGPGRKWRRKSMDKKGEEHINGTGAKTDKPGWNEPGTELLVSGICFGRAFLLFVIGRSIKGSFGNQRPC